MRLRIPNLVIPFLVLLLCGYVATARQQVFYFDCGTSDESLPDNLEFDRELDSLGVRHTFHEYPGSHTWDYWRSHLHESLVAVTRAMAGPDREERPPSVVR